MQSMSATTMPDAGPVSNPILARGVVVHHFVMIESFRPASHHRVLGSRMYWKDVPAVVHGVIEGRPA